MVVPVTLLVWIGGAVALLGAAMFYRLHRFRAASVEVNGKYRGRREINGRALPYGRAYVPEVSFQCPFTGQERLVAGQVGTYVNAPHHGSWLIKVRVAKAPPHEARLWQWERLLFPSAFVLSGLGLVVIALAGFFRRLGPF